MLASLVATHPTTTLLPASFALSFLSLSLTPSFVSLILLLTSLLLYTKEAQKPPKRNAILKLISIWVALTASISISHIQPSIHALSNLSTSVASLILLSGLSSMVALTPVICRHWVKLEEPQMQVLVFPTLWATIWLAISWSSPLGRLVTWSPLTGIESYQWTRTLFGFAGIDWITAAWASIAAAMLENILHKHEKEEILLVDAVDTQELRKPTRDGANHLAPLAGVLLALVVPSFFVNPLPLPPFSSKTTPLRVACILPERSEASQLERFLAETSRFTSLAKIMLWPEGAVVFENAADKNEALEKVQKMASDKKAWIGVSFEERLPGDASTRDGLHRNGLTLVGPEGIEMTYYKRRLVPIAESFSQISYKDDPEVHTIDLPRPHDVPKDKWKTRIIPLTASICLDFSAPLVSLSSHPSLILAPAKTWHVGVGRAMYELARARGEEIGAEVLWCDGGEGGLSGVAGDVQVGAGSWVKIIGVPYPAETHRTLYGLCGDWLTLALLLGVPGLIWAVRRNEFEGRIGQAGGSAIAWARQHGVSLIARIRGTRQHEPIAPAPQSQSLIDDT